MALRIRSLGRGALGLAAIGFLAWAWQPEASFSVGERLALVAKSHWPGASDSVALPPKVSITPAASEWLDTYFRARREVAKPVGLRWEQWVRPKLEHDWAVARAALAGTPAPPVKPSAPPADLVERVGVPPPLAEVVHPTEHHFQIAPGDSGRVTLKDHPDLGERFRSYRNAHGVMGSGVPFGHLPSDRIETLGAKNGLTRSWLRIWKSLSAMEGGFDSVNTYDTGHVSVGFVQFTTGPDGRDALIEVLNEEKRRDPAEFRKDFQEMGIDVDAQGILRIVDPADGRERQGPDAVACVTREPRIAAAFVCAGRRSTAFQSAQLRVAMRRYDPSHDELSIRLANGKVLRGQVRDAVRSEAGIATLLDGKVNTGKLSEVFQEALQKVVIERRLKDWDEIARHERAFIQGSKNRTDFLAVSSLSQPPATEDK